MNQQGQQQGAQVPGAAELQGQQQDVHEHALWPQQCSDGGDGGGGGLDARAVHSKVVPSAAWRQRRVTPQEAPW